MTDAADRGAKGVSRVRRLARALRRRRQADKAAPRRSRLRFEPLEPRRVLTNRVILDFTPDVIAGEYSVGRYLDLFDGSSVSDANRFLDYNGDNVVDAADAKLSVKKIGARVTKLLGDFSLLSDVDLEVGFTTNLTAAGDPGLGEKLLEAGQDSSFTNTYVIYVGSDSPRPNHDDLGFAHQAFAEENSEFHAFAFARPIQLFLAGGEYPWKKVAKLTPLDFTNNVSFAILHELGHLWGLGHLRDVDATTTNIYMPNQYHHLMNYPKQANPDLARFRNDSDHPMEIGSRSFGASFQPVNAWNEVHNSLRENLFGVFEQTTVPNTEYPDVPTYKEFLGSEMNFGDDNPAPSPVTSAPAASLGTRGATSAADVADLLDAGFNAFRTDLLDDFAARLNLPADSLPLMPADLADLLGLGAALDSVVAAANFSDATSMLQLRSQLIGAGFDVHSALTDAQLAAAPTNQPVDFLRVSRTYALPSLEANVALGSSGLDALGDLNGVSLAGQLDVAATTYFTIAFGVDSAGFYLLPGNGVFASLAVSGNVDASIPGGNVSGNASLGFAPQVRLSATAADGRIRLSDLDGSPESDSLANRSVRAVAGDAGVVLEIVHAVGDRNLEYGGSWVWQLAPDGGGFSLDQTVSGIDQEAFANSLTDLIAGGLDDARQSLAEAVQGGLNTNLSFLDSSVVDSFVHSLSGDLAVDFELGSARLALAESGFELVSLADAGDYFQAIVQGTSLGQDLIQVRFARTANHELSFELDDVKEYLGAALPAQFNLDDILPSNIDITATVEARADVTVGVAADGAPFLRDAGAGQPAEFSATAAITLALERLGGTVGPLYAGVAHGTGELSVNLGVDLVSSEAAGRVTIDQLAADVSAYAESSVNAAAELDLPLAVRLGETGPGFLTSYSVQGQTASPMTFTFGPEGSTAPQDGFGPIVFEMGDMVRDAIGPVLKQLRAANPLPDELVDLVTSPLPIYGKSVLDLLKTFDSTGQYELVALLFEISKVIKDLDAVANSGNSLDLSAYGFGSAPSNPGAGSTDGGDAGPFDSLLNKLAEYDIQLPILEDTGSKVLSMIFDPNVELDLIVWDPDRFELATEQRVLDIPFASYGIPFILEIRGTFIVDVRFGLFGDPEIGFTTRGITQTGNMLDGFYLGDNFVDGVDKAEFGVLLEVQVGVAGQGYVFGYKVGELTVEGGLSGEFGVDLVDWNGSQPQVTEPDDYRLYRDEIVAIIDDPSLGMSCLFVLTGSITPFIEVGYEISDDGTPSPADLASLAGIPTSDSHRENLPPISWTDTPCSASEPVPLADAVGDVLQMRSLAVDDPGQKIDVRVRKDVEGNPDVLRLTIQDQGVPDPRTRYQDFDIDENGNVWAKDVEGNPRQVNHLALVGTLQDDAVNVAPAASAHFDTFRVETYEGADRVDFGDYSAFEAADVRLTTTYVWSGPGDDRVYGTPVRDVVEGGDGADRLYGNRGNDDLRGGDGVDIIQGQDGDDSILGGAGNDTLSGNRGDDTINGEDGDDRIFGNEDHDSLAGGVGKDWLIGGEGNDTLRGGDDDDALLGNEGNDKLFGDAGKDFLYGDNSLYLNSSSVLDEPDCAVNGYSVTLQIEFGIGCSRALELAEIWYVTETPPGGDDELHGGDGADWLEGGVENDTLYGDAGDDRLYGSSLYHAVRNEGNARGNDTIHGGDGNDILGAANGDDFLHGDAGDDRIHAGSGDDEAHGGADHDLIEGGTGQDRLFGDAGDDLVEGGEGNDSLEGGAGADQLWGGRQLNNPEIDGADTLRGGDGPDTIRGQNQNDSLFGDAGSDTLYGGDENDRIEGGADDDLLHGDDGDDHLVGDAGSDTLYGYAGNDQLFGHSETGAGDDAAADWLYGEHIPVVVFVGLSGTFDDLLEGGAGPDHLDGGSGDDRIYGHSRSGAGDDAAADHLHGQNGDDLLYGQRGDDQMEGDDGRDALWGGDGDDRLQGGADDDLIRGEEGADTLEGGADDDVVYGDAGNDTLRGDDGRDYLDGGVGIDWLYGGAGDDHLQPGEGVGGELHGDDDDDLIFGTDGGPPIDPNFFDSLFVGDRIFGGRGDDRIFALGGADYIDASSGDDWVDAGFGADYVMGGEGDDTLVAADDLGDTLDGGYGDDQLHGSHLASDLLSGGPGDDLLRGYGGADSLSGGPGDDSLDGGAGADTLDGEDGSDILDAGGGNGDLLRGGAGDDVLYGADDGADLLLGGLGRDRLLGRGGNDELRGDAGDDILDGGDGDDLLIGGANSDLLVGGAHHDTLYGHDPVAGDDDGAVDSLYGDFGTNGDEPFSGRDRLYGQDGNDQLFGEGNDDLLDGGTGADNRLDYSSGEGANPTDFIAPSPTPAPTIQPGAGREIVSAALPYGAEPRGRFGDLFGSSTIGFGAESLAPALESSLAVGPHGAYVAWVDGRSGNLEIFVARLGATGWEPLGDSAQVGGVSRTAGSSRKPQLLIGADGQPLVVWNEVDAAGSHVFARRWDATAPGGGAWVEMAGSAAGLGIGAAATAESPRVVLTSLGPVVGWLDRSAGVANVYLRRFNGVNWETLGASAAGGGVSGAANSVVAFDLATDGVKTAAAWSEVLAGKSQIRLREWDGAAWSERSGSASGNGVSQSTYGAWTPTVAYFEEQLFVAWRDEASTATVGTEIYVVRHDGASWKPASSGSNAGTGVSQAAGGALAPRFAVSSSGLSLAWIAEQRTARSGDARSIQVRRWNGERFEEQRIGDARGDGVIPVVLGVDDLVVAADALGRAYVGWLEPLSDSARVRVLGDLQSFGPPGATYVADGQPGTTLQELLDAHDLGPGDAIVVRGAVSGATTIGADDSGVLIVGEQGAEIFGALTIQNANTVTLQNLTFVSAVAINDSTNVAIVRSKAEIITVNGGSQLLLREVDGNVIALQQHVDARVEGVGAAQVQIQAGVADVQIRASQIENLTLANAASGLIERNSLTSLSIQAPFDGKISDNDVGGGGIGVFYGAAANLTGNRIHGANVGVVVQVADPLIGLGFVGTGLGNVISGNTVGVDLRGGRMRNQRISGNATGVIGAGVLGGDDPNLANLIERNTVGAKTTGPIQFNRFSRNATAIAAADDQTIAHNTFDLNIQRGVAVDGRTDVRILQNSFFSLTGDNVRIFGGSSEIELRGNAMWAEAGYDVYVADDSQRGFFSDYNALHASPVGKLVHWVFDFTDLLDWQADVARFDLHSLGTTAVNPAWATPRFIAPSWGDLRTFDLVARRRGSSPTVDASDARLDQMTFAGFVNLLTNPGFELGTAGWTTTSTIGAGAPGVPAYLGASHLTSGETAVAEAKQTIDLTSAGYTAEQLDSGALTIAFGGRLRSLEEAVHDHGQVRLVFLDAGQQVISTIAPLASSESQRWELSGERAAIPAGTRALRFEFIATRRTGPSNDAWFDNGFVYVMPETYAPDLGAWGATSYDEPTSTPAHLDLQFPDLYVDWERDVPHDIRWRSLSNSTNAQIRIDLYQDGPDGPAFLANLTPATEDDGAFSWTPANNSVAYGARGLRIQITSTANPTIHTRSVEPFTVPENTTTFFVNDRSAANDEYTTAIGDNRRTGKSASQPKPSPANLLRTYSLGPTHQLFVDTGAYDLFDTLVLSGNGTGSDDEGFVFTGPSSPSRTALLRHALPSERSVLELDDADFVTLAHLTLQSGTRGLWVHNGSTQLIAHDLRIPSPTENGVYIEAASSASRLERIVVTGSGGYGILVEGTVGSVSESRISGSRFDGLRISNSGATLIEANEVFENRESGIVVWNGNAAVEVTIGAADLSLGRGNRVYSNLGRGIQADGRIVVAGNTVWGHDGTEAAGISIGAGAQALRNVSHSNFFGIQALFDGVVEENRVYDNADAGIRILAGGFARRNVIYSNARGIDVDSSSGAWPIELTNNVIYANSLGGVHVNGGSGAQVLNNTVVQTLGNALELTDGARGATVYNNILAAAAGFALSVSSNSQVDFQSDFNLYHVTGTGRVARWQGVPRPTLASWQAAALQDLNGLNQDPHFVDKDGGDGFVGYASASSDGRDDDFHLQSLHGSAHGGALAPVRDGTSGLPVVLDAVWTLDGSQSPGVDRGRDGLPVGAEPAPNGGFINLGAYGGTEQASLSPIEFVTVFRPDGGESWPVEQTIVIRWRASEFTGTADVELVADDGSGGWTTVDLLADDVDNDGEFSWTIPSTVLPGAYAIRVTTQANGQSDQSNAPFQITGPVSAFYVNVSDDDDLSNNQFTTAAGVDGNDGLSPATPMASLAALLATYDLEPGDVVYVDSGRYELFANIPLEEDDSGVVIQGPTDAGLAAVFDRANSSIGSYVFEMAGADDVTLTNLTLTGAEVAVLAPRDAGSDRLSLLNNHIHGQGAGGSFSGAGVVVESGNVGAVIVGNVVRDNGYTGIQVDGADGAVRDNRVSGHNLGIVANWNGLEDLPREIRDNVVFDNHAIGIQIGDDDVTVAGNVVYGHASSISSVGIYASEANVQGNTAFANSTGIRIDGFNNRAEANRVYANRAGIVVNNATDLFENIVYSNSLGIDVESGFGGYQGRISNNLLYDQSDVAMRLTGARPGSQILNNTIWQPVGDGIRLEGGTSGVWLRNNIFAIDAGVALDVVANSQVGLDSDYNLFHLGPTARAARWGAVEYSDVGQFAGEVGRERHSFVGEPGFVDVDGADQSLAFRNDSLATPRLINDFEPDFAKQGRWYPLMGLEGDYLETGSSHGTAIATYRFSVTKGGSGELSYSADWPSYPGLGTAQFSVSANGPINVSLIGEGTVDQVSTNEANGTIFYSASDDGQVEIYLSMSGGNIHFDRLNGQEEDSPGLELLGSWRNQHFQKDVHRVHDAVGDEVGEWTIDDLEVGETYALHALWDPADGLDYQVRYEVWDGDTLVGVKFLRQSVSSSASENVPLGQDNLGFYRLESGPLRVRMSGSPGTNFLADAMRVRQIPGDRGADDILRVVPTSIAVDHGDPQTYFVGERLPHGARANVGYVGNTPEANVSFVQTIQVQTPNGGEKLEAGQTLQVDWLTSGILAQQPIALINAGGPTIENWLFDDYLVTRASPQQLAPSELIELPAADLAAPAEAYRTYQQGEFVENSRLAYHLPAPDGVYTLRLHFVEPWANDVGTRVFDLVAQGNALLENYDIVAAVGGALQVDVRSFQVAAAAGNGILLELIGQGSSYPPVISAIEVLAANPFGVADPLFDVELSLDQGQNWSTIAAGAALDRYGRGSIAWPIPTDIETDGLTAITRVRYAERQDESDHPFAIANDGTSFFVNMAGDADFSDNEYTTAAGSDVNNGKAPDRPMATLGALLRAYDLEPGDVVYVDSGDYSLRVNLRLEPDDSGVVIQGPTQSGREAVFDRGNRSNGSYVFEFAGADDVTLSNLAIVGAEVGVYAGPNADSDRLVIRNSRIEDHGTPDRFFGIGVQVETSNDHALLENNFIRGGGWIGILLVGADGVIRGNEVTDNAIGIELPWSGHELAPRLVEQNRVYANMSHGIRSGDDDVRIRFNEVHAHRSEANDSVGIEAGGSEIVADNLVHDNDWGIIAAGFNGLATRNRVFNNGVGIRTHNGNTISDNRVFSNAIGITTLANSGSPFTGQIINNVIYANAQYGVWLQTAGVGAQLTNNTIFQPSGDAVRVDQQSANVRLRNNILAVASGYALHVDADSQVGFDSDYNLFHTTGDGKLGRWQNVDFLSLDDWARRLNADRHGLVADPLFADRDGADNVLGFANGVDRGLDDDFRVLAGSPTLDRGDPATLFFAEPAPNGGRVNLGADGGTPQALPSQSASISILAPQNYDRAEAGETALVSWTTSGLVQETTVAAINVGGGLAGDWMPDRFALESNLASYIDESSPIDLTAVTNAAPRQVYRSFVTSAGVGSRIAYQLPLADGDYEVRLHFIEPWFDSAGKRRFDVRLQGAVVLPDFDPFAAASAMWKAVAREFDVVVAGGQGFSLELTSALESGAILAGIEITQVNPAGIANPTVNVEASFNNGVSWTLVAQNVPLDRWGSGSTIWNVPGGGATTQALVRVASTNGGVVDVSDSPFQIAPPGQTFYVNDAAAVGDLFTTASGQDANSGKSPAAPMRDLYALLSMYDLGPDDVVYFDAGAYDALREIVIGADDSGVRIVGASPTTTVVNRRRLEGPAGSLFVLNNADDVSIERLGLTGAATAIELPENSDSDRFRLVDNDVFGNRDYGVRIAVGNDDALVSGNRIHDTTGWFAFGYGVLVNASGARIEGNELFGNRYGVHANSNSAATPNEVVGNTIFDNEWGGIQAYDSTIVSGNAVYNHLASEASGTAIGIEAGNARVFANVVHSNDVGIFTSGGNDEHVVSNNRLYDNDVAIQARGFAPHIVRNAIYSNSIGLEWGGGGGGVSEGLVAENLIYENSNGGILVAAGDGSSFMNNTVFQAVGDALSITGGRGLRVWNNLLWVESGFALAVAAESQDEFQSDFNLFQQGVDPNARAVEWGDDAYDLLTDWRGVAGLDAGSLEGDPLFIDRNGADNRFGYDPLLQIDGGLDDNFHLTKSSPAIDRGDGLNALPFDHEGNSRRDDDGAVNAGRMMYLESPANAIVFQPAAVGAAQDWRADDAVWSLALPFDFPFFETTHSSVFVSSNGLLQFGGATTASSDNSSAALFAAPRIAPLWDDLTTAGPGDDVFVESSATEVAIRWNATHKISGADVQFTVTLSADGAIRFDYGRDNLGLTPTIGLSAGDGVRGVLAEHDGRESLMNARSVEFARESQAYVETVLDRTYFYTPFGTAQGWTDVNAAYSLDLPFAFPLGDASYSTVQVSPNGFLYFDGPADPTSADNSLSSLIENRIVAPLWQSHWMDGLADDVFIDDSQPDRVVILWDVSNSAGDDVRFAATLFADGRVRCEYGGGEDLVPRIGISNGDGVAYLSSYDERQSLAGAGVLEYEFAPSYVEVGAYEFQGSSLDETPPTVVSAELRVVEGPPARTEVQVLFSEAIDPIDARAPANYELWEAGLNGVLGDGDDVSYDVAPRYEAGTLLVTLDILPLGTLLASGLIRLVVHGDSTIHDLSGLKLDGDGDDIPGGNFTAANRPPVVAPVADASVDEGRLLDFVIGASDPDSDSLRFELQSGAPEGATLDPATGRFQWTPGEADAPATYIVAIAVRDDGVPSMAATRSFTITANEVNDAPVIQSVPDQTARDGAELTVAISAIDPELNSLVYSLDEAPAGAVIDSVTGQFRWTPSEAQSPGEFAVVVRVTDDGAPSRSALVSFDVIVSEENQPPQWNATPSRTISEGVAFQTTLVAIDPEGGVVDYEFVGVAPTGASIHPATGLFSWTPAETQGPSVQTISVRATDRGTPPLSTTASFNLTVLEVNATPAIASIASQTVQAGRTLTVDASASDVDVPVNQLTFSLAVGAPTGATIHSTTGAFSWTPADDQVGDHSITVRVVDNGTPSRSNTTTFVVSVLTAANTPPTISAVANQSILEDGVLAPVSFTVGDLETESNQLVVTAVSSNQSLVLDSAITLAGAGAVRTIAMQPVADRNGSATITITVSDGDKSTSAEFVLEVAAVNDAPSFTLAGDPPATLANSGPVEATRFATSISAGPTDESSQSLQFQFEVQSSTGNLSFASGPAIDPITGTLTYEPTANSMGTATVSIRLVDNGSAEAPNVAVGDAATFVIEVRPDKWTNYVRSRDVDRDGFVVPRDALFVINELNQREVSATDGRLPPLSAELQPPPFYDVTGDGFVTPVDALNVINFLNGFGEGESGASDGERASSEAGVGTMADSSGWHILGADARGESVSCANIDDSTAVRSGRQFHAPGSRMIDAVWQTVDEDEPTSAVLPGLRGGAGSESASAVDAAWDDSQWLEELIERR